jgi:drug/metabolite transporter (DMT)-like permease
LTIATVTSTLQPKPRTALALCLLTGATLAWAGNHVVARAIAGHVPPASLNAVRWLIVALLVCIFSHRHIARDWKALSRSWRLLVILGMTGGGIFGTLQYVGLQYTTVLNMGVFNSVAPPMIALASWITFRDRLRWRQVVGIGVSLLGVLAIISRLDLAALQALSFNQGDVIIVANMLLWAFYSAFLRLRPSVSLWSFLFAISIPAAIANLPWAAYEYASGFQLAATPMAIGAALYAALGTSILGYFGWSRGVEALGPGRASVFLHLIPIYGIFFGTTLFEEQFQLFHAVGIVLILTGVVLTATGQPNARSAEPETGSAKKVL